MIADGAPFVSTDWTSGQLISLGDALSPLTEATVYAAVVPGRLTTSDEGEETYEVSDGDLAAMMEAVNAGNSPESFEGNLANVDRASSPWRCATAAAFRERRPAAASF